jgi:hypothetical protein
MGQFATDRSRQRLSSDVMAMRGLNTLQQLAKGIDPTTSGQPSTMMGILGQNFPSYMQGKMPGLDMGNPYELLKGLNDQSQGASAGGNAAMWENLNDNPELLAGLREYGNRNLGGFAARRYGKLIDQMGIANAEAGVGEGAFTALGQSPLASYFGPTGAAAPNVTPPAAPAPSAPATDGMYQGGEFTQTNGQGFPTGFLGQMTNAASNDSPVRSALDQTFTSAVGRAPTNAERNFWLNKYTTYGGGAEGLNSVVSDIQNSQPAAKFKETGDPAPVVENAQQASGFYDWLFSGSESKPDKNAWIAKYLQVLGLGEASLQSGTTYQGGAFTGV